MVAYSGTVPKEECALPLEEMTSFRLNNSTVELEFCPGAGSSHRANDEEVNVLSLVLNFQKDGWLTDGQMKFLHALTDRIKSLQEDGYISRTPAWYEDTAPCLVTLHPDNLANGYTTVLDLFQQSMVHPVRHNGESLTHTHAQPPNALSHTLICSSGILHK